MARVQDSESHFLTVCEYILAPPQSRNHCPQPGELGLFLSCLPRLTRRLSYHSAFTRGFWQVPDGAKNQARETQGPIVRNGLGVCRIWQAWGPPWAQEDGPTPGLGGPWKEEVMPCPRASFWLTWLKVSLGH